MVRSQYKALEEMRNGVLDVLPASSLEGLTFTNNVLTVLT